MMGAARSVRMPLAKDADKPRYSIAFFTQPNRNSVVIDPTGKYPPITAGVKLFEPAVEELCCLSGLDMHSKLSCCSMVV